MALDWTSVIDRYGDGRTIATIAGGKTFRVTGADETGVHIKNALWRDTLARADLERAVELVESNRISGQAGVFVEEYRAFVADVRVTSAAHVLKDLGYLR